MSAQVRAVSQADFVDVVVEGSKDRPVVVDFWAEWCGPCRQLSPLLEKMAGEFAGEVDVVTVNVDENQALAQQFRVQGIPAVKAFADGRMVDEFTGLLPEPAIAQFFAKLAPSPADKLVVRATTTADEAERAALLEQAMELEADHPAAALALAALQDDQTARETLARARPTPEVQQAMADLELRLNAGDLDELRDAVEAGDDDARVRLGQALAAAGQHDEAIEVLLEGVRTPSTREAAREALVTLFTSLGADDPLVRAARPRLASALY